jgi:hypothetical protein
VSSIRKITPYFTLQRISASAQEEVNLRGQFALNQLTTGAKGTITTKAKVIVKVRAAREDAFIPPPLNRRSGV